MQDLLKNQQLKWVLAPVAAGSSIAEGSAIIDMANWETVQFITPIDDSVDTGVATLAIQQNTINDPTGMATLAGTSASATSAANDDLNDTLLVSEVWRPQERYVRAYLTSATANIAYGDTIAILSGPRTKPITEDATIQTAVIAFEPEEA